MGWAIAYDETWQRDIGYGVPAVCDHPGCSTEIDRGLAYVCGGEPYGGDHGCGLYFCYTHLLYGSRGRMCVQMCEKCLTRRKPFTPKPDTLKWLYFKMTDPSWKIWREENDLVPENTDECGSIIGDFSPTIGYPDAL